MQAPNPPTQIVHFGIFQIDLKARELHKAGVKVKLQEQPFRVLALLVDRAGQVVTREELQQKIWPTDAYVAFDQGLNNAIKKVRDALGDSADSPRFIETLARHGYRFVAPVGPIPQRPGPLHHGTLGSLATPQTPSASAHPESRSPGSAHRDHREPGQQWICGNDPGLEFWRLDPLRRQGSEYPVRLAVRRTLPRGR